MRHSSGFKDHFSDQSERYARYRPHYPVGLLHYLATLCERHDLAWDCATGSGQGAVALSRFFGKVVATDASAAQIESALPDSAVSYRVAPAEDSGLAEGSVDLVTVGQALHWFDIDQFFAEARRVLVRGGILGAWCYEVCEVSDACDAVVDELYTGIVGEFWPPERRLVEQRYEGIEFPGTLVQAPPFEMSVSWDVGNMLGYLRTWSACSRYQRRHGQDPVNIVEEALRAAWGETDRTVRWPLTLRVSRC